MTDKQKGTLRLDVQAAFEQVVTRVERRLILGAEHYGDASLLTPLGASVDEIQEEIEDVLGWAVILWVKMERVRKGLIAMPHPNPSPLNGEGQETNQPMGESNGKTD